MAVGGSGRSGRIAGKQPRRRPAPSVSDRRRTGSRAPTGHDASPVAGDQSVIGRAAAEQCALESAEELIWWLTGASGERAMGRSGRPPSYVGHAAAGSAFRFAISTARWRRAARGASYSSSALALRFTNTAASSTTATRLGSACSTRESCDRAAHFPTAPDVREECVRGSQRALAAAFQPGCGWPYPFGLRAQAASASRCPETRQVDESGLRRLQAA